ncbi:MAG: hydrogenase maturation protease [Candidatus Heimdallarchaeota archaeon]|nr:hydrogenase maturation protease [Candidatus Heimdallarchaeota archaeon]MBY8993058.1 hydrogenase maturation protease [Candidatus Heimdallarchaeota archaeon]
MSNGKDLHIIGVGNLTRLDDGVAIRIIQELEKITFPKNIKITDLGTGGVDIALALDNWKHAIIIDAVDIKNLKPGAIVEFEIKDKNLPEVKGLSSTHGFDALTALKLAFALDDFTLPKEILIIGVQVKNLEGFGVGLSKEVEDAIPNVISRIQELITKYKI